jgi:hypothetical protein
MPKREIGLMGYIGEAIVEQWLRWKYPPIEYNVVAQIIPSGISRAGGGYLDFGVIGDGAVVAVYEVKSQDYILGKDFAINKALLHIWNREGRQVDFETQEGTKYAGHPDIGAFLVLLVAPNNDGLQKIGMKNLPRLILFQDIWSELGEAFSLESAIAGVREDAAKVVAILRRPSAGKRVTKTFLKLREKLRS